MSGIAFKSIRKKRPIRERKPSSDEESSENDGEDLDHSDKLAETLELQKLRKRPHGVNAVTLASGKKVSKVDELVHNDPDPFKIKTGGLLTLDKGKFIVNPYRVKVLKRKSSLIDLYIYMSHILNILARIAKSQVEDEDGAEPMVGTQFSKETRVRDEDEEMKKFIENEMEQRRRKNMGKDFFNSSENETTSIKYMTPEEAALAALPEHLKATTGKKVSWSPKGTLVD